MCEKVILASASPRRKELLKLIFSKYTVIPSDVEESVPENLPAAEHPEYLARIKCEDVATAHSDSLVIGADTVVICDNKILGKPKTDVDAHCMLKMLSGRTHKVVTGCAIAFGGTTVSFSVSTEVEFYKLSESEIDEYIKTGEPFDKAGGYGIQSLGAMLVKGINGDYYNVVGLPIAELKRKILQIAPEALV